MRHVFDYVLDDWSLTHPSGVVERKERMVDDERSAQLLEGTYSASGARLSRTEYNYKWESWGFAMTNRVEGFDGLTNITTWTYYTSGNGKGQIKTEKRQSGLLTQYTYDSVDRVISETRSGPDMMTETTAYDYTPVDASDPVLPVDTRSRTVVRKLNNIECERTYYVYSSLTNIVERVGTQGAAFGGTNVLRTVTAFYQIVANDLRSGLVASIRHEDGKFDVYDYSLVSNLWVRTVTHLHEQSLAPVSGKTTRDITTTNARGEILEQKTEAFIDGIWYTIARNRMTYNAEGRRTSLENLAGQVTTTAWDGWSVTYNGENRPVLWENFSTNSPTPNSSTHNSSTPTLLLMSYDRMGRRVTKNSQRFVYDGYLQIANFERASTNSQLTTYNSQLFIWDSNGT